MPGLRYLPLAEGSAILYLAPIFIVVLSGPVLGERPNRARWIAAIVGFVGVLILLRPGSAVFHPATLLLLGAALCNAFYHMLTRRLADDDIHTTLFYSALVGAVGLTVFLPWGLDPVPLTLRDGGLLLALGCACRARPLVRDCGLRACTGIAADAVHLRRRWSGR